MSQAKRAGEIPEGELDVSIWRAERPVVPAPAEARIYAFALDHAPAVIRRFEELLSPEELDRAGRFVYQGLRYRFIAGRAGLRLALGAALARDPAALRFEYGPQGKPRLTSGALQFNLSHSEGIALLALTQDVEVGVDVEAISRDIELDDMANRFFSPRERVEYRRFPASGRADAFFRCWTRKEAIIKAAGDGLSLPLDRFDVSIGDDAPRLLRFLDRVRPDDWTLAHLTVGPGFAGALAARRGGMSVTCRRFDAAELHGHA